jgi:hypothetical protein
MSSTVSSVKRYGIAIKIARIEYDRLPESLLKPYG